MHKRLITIMHAKRKLFSPMPSSLQDLLMLSKQVQWVLRNSEIVRKQSYKSLYTLLELQQHQI